MPIDSVQAGQNVRQVMALGDGSVASNVQTVAQFHNADANAIAGSQYSAVAAAVPVLFNGATFDRARAATGGTGLLAVVTESQKATYSAVVAALTPAATATDFVQIAGAAAKTVRVTSIKVSGVANAASANDVYLIKRTATNAGGTTTAATLVAHDSNDAAASASVIFYSANGTALGASAGNLKVERINLNTNAAGTIAWDFTQHNDKAPVLRGTAQSLNLNWNGAAIPAGATLDVEISWTEE